MHTGLAMNSILNNSIMKEDLYLTENNLSYFGGTEIRRVMRKLYFNNAWLLSKLPLKNLAPEVCLDGHPWYICTNVSEELAASIFRLLQCVGTYIPISVILYLRGPESSLETLSGANQHRHTNIRCT
jgi:hypothetical protein